ncbi:DUF2730 family protein [Paracoccus sp. P2]|uniref:DUF2730 family protein n=1 Tax=Paracoccus sp. P2 TaxID=3248840 RepID=UPI00391F379B
MRVDLILPYLPLLNVIIIPIAGWLLRTFKKDLASKEDLTVQATRITNLERRTDLLDRDIKHLPDQKDFSTLKEAVAALAGDSKAQTQQLKAVGISLARIEDYLLKAGK